MPKPFSILLPLLAFCLAAAVGACGARDSSLESTLKRLDLAQPRPESFRVCRGFGCRSVAPAAFSDEEWGSVRAIFEPVPADAVEERARVREAVSLWEILLGPKVGTGDDQAENTGTGRGTVQLDCVAEAVNTSIFLVMLENDGLLRFHTVARTEKRGLGIFSPHNTAVLRETGNGRSWAVDSWFHANGVLPEVIDLDRWRAGYVPE